MHPINKLLSPFGLQVSHIGKTPKGVALREFRRRYEQQLSSLAGNTRCFRVFREFMYEGGAHPKYYLDHECEFAAKHLSNCSPGRILDVG